MFGLSFFCCCFSIKKYLYLQSDVQKQPPEVFYEKSCSQNFRNICRKTPVLEPLFNKFYLKETSTRVLCSCELKFREYMKKIYCHSPMNFKPSSSTTLWQTTYLSSKLMYFKQFILVKNSNYKCVRQQIKKWQIFNAFHL